jgi:NADPH:quinone reductase-like Zn-dependent oxidoreductase
MWERPEVRAAILTEAGLPPSMGAFDAPVAEDGEVVVAVRAAGLNHFDLLKASGRFYTGPPPLPSVVGSDGVGVLGDGRRVFFDATVAPFGSMAEQALVAESSLFDVAEGVDDLVAAALGNTGLAAWLALSWRARLEPGETVLVLGATGALGTVAIQAARLQRAGRVVAAALDEPGIERLEALGADAVVVLDDSPGLADALREATGGGPDVIIDPLWGGPALAAMHAAGHGARHIQLGHMAGAEASVPATAVRAAAIDLRGFALFHAPIDVRREAYLRVTRAAADGAITVRAEAVPLSAVHEAWARQARGAGTKLVIVP